MTRGYQSLARRHRTGLQSLRQDMKNATAFVVDAAFDDEEARGEDEFPVALLDAFVDDRIAEAPLVLRDINSNPEAVIGFGRHTTMPATRTRIPAACGWDFVGLRCAEK